MKTFLNLIIILWTGTVWAGTYNGGLGTEINPYRISNAGNWQELMNTQADWDKQFVLTQNIIFVFGADLSPIGTISQPFTGVMDGQEHYLVGTIINLPDESRVGLFGSIGSSGQVKYLGSKINVSGKGYVGGMAGQNSGTITDCYVTGSISGTTDWVGGLVGLNQGTLSRCYSTGSISGKFDVGGLAGGDGGSITSCYASGSVSGEIVVGGLVGWRNSYNSLTDCYAIGSVTGTGNYIGGLVGYNHGHLTTCYATGSVEGADNYVGGLVGYNVYDSRITQITNCYAAGSVNGFYYVGGLVGWNENAITSCYAAGKVSGTQYIGGLVGVFLAGTITASFWDIQTSTLTDGVGDKDPDPSGVMGKTTIEMKKQSTFTSAGWDFINIWANIPNQTYPYLRTDWIADLNHDGKVNLTDFEIFASQWLRQ